MVVGLATLLGQGNNGTPLPPPTPVQVVPLPFLERPAIIPSIERVVTVSPSPQGMSSAPKPKRKDLETEGPNEGVTIVYDNDGVAFYLVPSGTWPVEKFKWVQVPRESGPVLNHRYQKASQGDARGVGPSGNGIRYI
jgi:hypothetical protein